MIYQTKLIYIQEKDKNLEKFGNWVSQN